MKTGLNELHELHELQSAKRGGTQYVLSFGAEKGDFLDSSRHYICNTPLLGDSKFMKFIKFMGRKKAVFWSKWRNFAAKRGNYRIFIHLFIFLK
jgi:hypothetical protein